MSAIGQHESGRKRLDVGESGRIVLACVTSPGVSGELIDRAIGHYRNATSAIAAIAFIQAN